MSSYDQFCPIARAADILCQRWTLLILRDLHSGCRRFNELKRGVPRISPTLLTQRLRMLEDFGLVCREDAEGGAQYTLTRAGHETGPLLLMFGIWGRRWMQHKIEAGELDEAFLIYAIETSLDVSCLAPRAVVHIAFNDRPKLKWDRWWLLIEDDNVQSCFDDPGRDVDIWIESDLRTLTEIWRGAEAIKPALQDGRIAVDGERRLVERFEFWFRGSLFNVVDLPPASINVPALLERFERG